ncbi:MFS transporter [Maritalea sp.]|uniref:MFS transporter n=1 Tax=Maritalea sp. TaxID=2003361 RepID=UPI003EF87CDB
MIKAQHRIYAIFFLFSFGLGSMLSRLADIQEQLNIAEGLLGLALMGSSFGMLIFLTFGAPLIERFGTKNTFLFANLAMATLYIVVGGSTNYALMVIAIFVGGMSVGAMEISINVEADRLEAHIGRRIMNRCHGFWSFGFFAAALLGGLMRHFDVAPLMHMIMAFPIVVFGTVLTVFGQLMAPEKPDASLEKTSIFTRPTPFILTLCAVSFGALIAEGAGIDWSTIYMRDSFEIGEFAQSTSLIAFTLVMALTRFFADPIVERFGTVIMARISLLITIVGVALVGVAPTFWLAVLGFMLLGMGSSIIYPLAVSAAARRGDRSASTNVASLAQTAFLVFFIGPASLGFIAEAFGIRMAFLAPLPLLILGLIFAGALGGRSFSGTQKSPKL